MSVEGPDGGSIWETSSEGCGAELSGTATAWKDGTDSDVLDEGRVDLGALDEGLEGADEEVGSWGVLESSFSALGEWSAESAGNDDIIWVLGQKTGLAGWLEVGGDLADAGLCWRADVSCLF